MMQFQSQRHQRHTTSHCTITAATPVHISSENFDNSLIYHIHSVSIHGVSQNVSAVDVNEWLVIQKVKKKKCKSCLTINDATLIHCLAHFSMTRYSQRRKQKTVNLKKDIAETVCQSNSVFCPVHAANVNTVSFSIFPVLKELSKRFLSSSLKIYLFRFL